MAVQSKQFLVKTSTIPGAGKGLFTKVSVKKGEQVIEYSGKVSSWKEADHQDGDNAYIFYVNRNHVINAEPYKKVLARYANDARGLSKIKGIQNNCHYTNIGNRIFITATRNIEAGSEILVGYGKEYWDTIRKNKL